MSLRTKLAALVFATTAIVVPACVDPVNFSRDLADAAVDEASASPTVDASTEGGGGCAPSGNPVQACLPTGDSCVADGDCCTRICRTGVCLTDPTCGAAGTQCKARWQCCSGRCEPSGASPGVCMPACQPDTSPCTGPQNCCSLACNNGLCGGPICLKIGDLCTNDTQCCQGLCDTRHPNHVCDPPMNAPPCRQTGEACGGDAGPECCSHVCNFATGRCDLGPGECRAPSSPCMSDMDCCPGGKCMVSGGQGVPVCVSSCVVDGQTCSTDKDCCGHQCRGQPSVCVSATTPTCDH